MPGSKDNQLTITDGVLVRSSGYAEGVIKIPSGVTSIGEDVFWGCSSLISIEIPSGVTSISEAAFWGCRNLVAASITINMNMKLREYIGLGSHLLIDRVNRSGNAYKFISGLGLEVKFNLMVREASTKLIDRFVNPQLREQLICYLLCMNRLSTSFGGQGLPSLPATVIPLIFNSASDAKYVCVDEGGLLKKERRTVSNMFRGYGK